MSNNWALWYTTYKFRPWTVAGKKLLFSDDGGLSNYELTVRNLYPDHMYLILQSADHGKDCQMPYSPLPKCRGGEISDFGKTSPRFQLITILPINDCFFTGMIYGNLKISLPLPTIITLPIYDVLPLSPPTPAILPSPTIRQGKVLICQQSTCTTSYQ